MGLLAAVIEREGLTVLRVAVEAEPSFEVRERENFMTALEAAESAVGAPEKLLRVISSISEHGTVDPGALLSRIARRFMSEPSREIEASFFLHRFEEVVLRSSAYRDRVDVLAPSVVNLPKLFHHALQISGDRRLTSFAGMMEMGASLMLVARDGRLRHIDLLMLAAQTVPNSFEQWHPLIFSTEEGTELLKLTIVPPELSGDAEWNFFQQLAQRLSGCFGSCLVGMRTELWGAELLLRAQISTDRSHLPETEIRSRKIALKTYALDEQLASKLHLELENSVQRGVFEQRTGYLDFESGCLILGSRPDILHQHMERSFGGVKWAMRPMNVAIALSCGAGDRVLSLEVPRLHPRNMKLRDQWPQVLERAQQALEPYSTFVRLQDDLLAIEFAGEPRHPQEGAILLDLREHRPQVEGRTYDYRTSGVVGQDFNVRNLMEIQCIAGVFAPETKLGLSTPATGFRDLSKPWGDAVLQPGGSYTLLAQGGDARESILAVRSLLTGHDSAGNARAVVAAGGIAPTAIPLPLVTSSVVALLPTK